MRRSPRSVPVALTAAVLLLVGCGTRADDLHEEKVEIDRTTTTGDLPCDVPEIAERALTEASLTATQADAATRATVLERLDELAASVPPSLADEVETMRSAFEEAFAGTEAGADPFDTTDYLTADQAIRRYVGTGCTEPAS